MSDVSTKRPANSMKSRYDAVILGAGIEPGRVNHGKLRSVLSQPLRVGFLKEHVAHEETVPRQFVDDADGEAVRGIGAHVAVLDVEIFALQISGQTSPQGVLPFGRKGLIDLAPPHLVLARRLLHDKAIVR